MTISGQTSVFYLIQIRAPLTYKDSWSAKDYSQEKSTSEEQSKHSYYQLIKKKKKRNKEKIFLAL